MKQKMIGKKHYDSMLKAKTVKYFINFLENEGEFQDI